MIAAIRSRLEWRASESTPRLPVKVVRKTFSDNRMMAEPTEPSAVICFADLIFDLEIIDSPKVVFSADYTTMPGLSGGARQLTCSTQHCPLIAGERARQIRTGAFL